MMVRKTTSRVVIALVAVVVLAACSVYYFTRQRYTKHTDSFFDTFDTVITVVAYTRTDEEWNADFQAIHDRFLELHKLYDIYNTYDGLNNVKTINDNAGVQPVKVSKDLIDLIRFSKDWDAKTGGRTNIAMGSVLSIWHQYREGGQDDPENAVLPPMQDLVQASKHTGIDNVIVDTQNSTVYLADKDMRLDVGAVAKGYATEVVSEEMAAGGMTSFMISSGGNIRAVGKPLDGVRERWGVGIQDPTKAFAADDNSLLDVVYINDGAVASSGGYQRYYVVNDQVYHHLIDPDTLMPANYYQQVTVMAPDAGVVDFMSTTLFLLPYDQSRALAERLGVEAIWVMPDGTVQSTPGMQAIMESHGASGAKAK